MLTTLIFTKTHILTIHITVQSQYLILKKLEKFEKIATYLLNLINKTNKIYRFLETEFNYKFSSFNQ